MVDDRSRYRHTIYLRQFTLFHLLTTIFFLFIFVFRERVNYIDSVKYNDIEIDRERDREGDKMLVAM